MYTYDNFHKVKEELEAKRRRARAEAEERSAALAEKSPEIAAIDEELRGTGMLIFKPACSGGDIEEIKKAKDNLLTKANELATKVYEEAAKNNQTTDNATEDNNDDKKSNDDVVDAEFEEK